MKHLYDSLRLCANDGKVKVEFFKPDMEETTLGTDPKQPDSDGDGMSDGWEWQNGFDPATHNGDTMRTDDDWNADPDGDGMTNAQEAEWGTSTSIQDLDGDGKPDGRDSDGDGVDDGVEIAQLSDPGDGSDGGESNSCVAVTFYFGDPSGSSSEKYWLHVCPAGGGLGNVPRAYHLVNSYYGICDTRTVNLRRGWMYEVSLTHAGTNLQSPDYDYALACTPPDGVTLDDPDGLFVTDDGSGFYFSGAGKVATLTVDPPAPSSSGTLGASVVIDRNTILFEDAYTNAPGEIVERQSTWTRICVSFTTGASAASGTFSVSQGGERIRLHSAKRSGTVVGVLQPVDLPPQSVCRMVFYAEGIKASSALNDVTLHAYVIGGGGLESDSKSLTVGQVKVDAVSDFPTNKTRHVYGPLEEVNLSIVPQQLFASTTMTGTIPYNGALTQTPTNYFMRVCNRRKNFSLTVRHVNGETILLPFSVIEPDKKLKVISYGAIPPELWLSYTSYPNPSYGDIGTALRMKMYMMPSYVSFQHLHVEELFAPAIDLCGYFADPILFPTNSLDHDEMGGAHRVLEVEQENLVGHDLAAYYQRGHKFLTAGSFALNIPSVWYSEDMKFTNDLNTVRQFHRLKSNGEMTVHKFGHWATRSLDNSFKPRIGPWEGE